MNFKSKKAGELKIIGDNILYLEGFYANRKAIIRMAEVNTIYLDKKEEEKSFTFLSAPISNISINDDSFDIQQILLQVNDGVTMCWNDGTVFKGRVKPVPEARSIRFIQLDGQRNSQVGLIKRITLSHEDGNIVISLDYNDDEKLLSNKTWLIKDDGALSENDYWKWDKIPNLCYYTKWTYRNGNYLEGSPKFAISQNDATTGAITIDETISTGIFKYPNGDRFEGDLSSKSVGSFFIDGTTFFVDGSRTKGNWLENFKLNNSQWAKVYKCSNPSEARVLAREFEHNNNFPQYEYGGILEYFDPSDADRQRLYDDNLIYDKANKHYTCKRNNTLLKFAVDGNGYRMWEIVYEDGKPKYKNYFTWYSNGVIESIKSYSYDTKNLYLHCNFFSDGKLRSAYQYGRGNNGENIIRKSKESHPTYGGYTCKLYDLNGNYERSIDWNIGGRESLFGGFFDNKEMAPAHLIFSKLNPIDKLNGLFK